MDDTVGTTRLEWFGCATFRLQTQGLTIFLDAYIDRVEGAAGTGLTADAVDECDWILVGHSHFDHLYGAERIMANTDARLVGSYETIRVMEAAGVPLERMTCVAGGERVDLGSGVHARVFPSLHSCVWSQSGEMKQADQECFGDDGLTLQEQAVRMAEMGRYLATGLGPAAGAHLAASQVGHSTRGDGGALVFLIETPDGSLFYQDTSGRWSGVVEALRPDVAIVAAAGRANVDGEPIQGSLAGFVASQVALLQPSTVILSHHDNWLPGFSVPTEVDPIRTAIAAVAPDTTLVELDYLSPVDIFAR